MSHRLLINMNVGAGLEFFNVQIVVFGKPGQNLPGFSFILLQIQLAAVAGRQDGRLACRSHTTQLLQRFDHLLRCEGHTLTHIHRCGLVIDAKRDESHAGVVDSKTERGILLLRLPQNNR